MASKKRNEWLDIDDSEDEAANGYDSGEEISKTSRAVKRRRVDLEDDEGSGELSDDQSENETENQPNKKSSPALTPAAATAGATSDPLPSTQPLKPHQPSKTTLNFKPKKSKPGVIYLSRIPPFMKPSTVRRLLEPHGPITRIFLTPEPSATHSSRVRSGGNRKKSYVDGWIEFAHKRDAKFVAEALNAQIIGGKKGGYYHDDLWNLKYLRGFKWHHLTEQIANENAERAARMRMEIAEARKEDRRFVANVERAKVLEGIKRTRRERGDEVVEVENGVERGGMARSGRQHKAKIKDVTRGAALEEPSAEVVNVLSKIF